MVKVIPGYIVRSRLTLTTSGCLEDKQNNNNNKCWERVIARKQLPEKARFQADQKRRKSTNG